MIGVEQGILLAMCSHCSVMCATVTDHTQQCWSKSKAGQWHLRPAVPGALSAPGLVIFEFGADLFYANAGRFAEDVRGLIERAPAPVNWLVVDAGAITNVDYWAARVLRDSTRKT